MTERERQLRELQASEARLRAAIQASPSQSSRSTSTTRWPAGIPPRSACSAGPRRWSAARSATPPRAAGGAPGPVCPGALGRDLHGNRGAPAQGWTLIDVEVSPRRSGTRRETSSATWRSSRTSPTAGARRRRSAPRGPGSSRPETRRDGASSATSRTARSSAWSRSRWPSDSPSPRWRPIPRRLRPCSSRRERSSPRPSTSYASSRVGSIPPCSRTVASPPRSRRWLRSPIPVEIDAPENELPRPVEAAAYYVVAEALANVAKYAGASGATVRICRENGRALVEVGDDGVGGADPAAGSGLRGLSDRVEALGGTLSIASPPGGGTRVSVEIPLHASSQSGVETQAGRRETDAFGPVRACGICSCRFGGYAQQGGGSRTRRGLRPASARAAQGRTCGHGTPTEEEEMYAALRTDLAHRRATVSTSPSGGIPRTTASRSKSCTSRATRRSSWPSTAPARSTHYHRVRLRRPPQPRAPRCRCVTSAPSHRHRGAAQAPSPQHARTARRRLPHAGTVRPSNASSRFPPLHPPRLTA